MQEWAARLHCSFRPSRCHSLLAWIRNMGGGPRTFPGGVTKWQWKRMQEKKLKHVEKSKLTREKQIYEMRRRAEVLAAHPELEMPWEKLATFPSDGITPDEHISSLVSRFQKPDSQDLWTDRDGPEQSTKKDGLHSAARISEKAPNRCQPTRNSSAALSKTGKVEREPLKLKGQSSEASPLPKTVREYLEAFESDPLGIFDNKGSGRKR